MESVETQVLPKIEKKPNNGKKYYIETYGC